MSPLNVHLLARMGSVSEGRDVKRTRAGLLVNYALCLGSAGLVVYGVLALAELIIERGWL